MNKEKIIILGHENPDIDSICSGIILESYLNNYTDYNASFIIPDKTLDNSTKAICQEFDIPYQKYLQNIPQDWKTAILVDHHERNLENKEIVAVFDHHPTTKNIKTPVYINKKISSTAALLVKGNEQYFDKQLIKLSLIASYVDSVSFNSTKARKEDKVWAESLIEKYNFNKDELYTVGLSLTDLSSLQEAAFECLKKYKIKDKNVEVSSIQLSQLKEHQEELNKIKEIIINYFLQQDLDVYVLLIHDMDLFQTTAYKIFRDGVEIDSYPKYTSRGNVIIPKLEEEINTRNFNFSKRKSQGELKKQLIQTKS